MRRNDDPTNIENDPHWYKDAVIYEVHVRAFYDSDRDGIGDLAGLTEKLDYLQDLGITALWLLPFYPSPLKDDGYDISDYVNIHPSYGTLRDFKRLLNEAHRRGLRVITELVLNHTSDQHPWFQRARRSQPGSTWRDYYVWSDTPDKYKDARIIFKDFETSNWAWDPVAKAYFWHRFYAHQPELNYESTEVQREIFKIVDFWLRLGVDGLRLDAVPYLYEEEGTNCESLPKTHDFLKALRGHVDQKFKNRMLLAEANQWPDVSRTYLGDDNECHMAFHFPLMPRMFMAISMEDYFPITEILENTPPIPENTQWAVFLRNHDELTLEMVTDEHRDYMYRTFAHDERARINLGIRHRLAPLLGNFRRRIELINALLFSLTGTPIIYYGDEIGMGDNIYLGDRNGVRTPMQWSADRNAGFSQANPQRLYLPIIIDPAYHYEAINVQVQQDNPHSLLWWMKRLIAIRKRYKAFGRGTLEFFRPENPKILAFVRRYQDECILVVANLSRFTQGVELDLSEFKDMTPFEIFGGAKLPPIRQSPYFLTLGPHGFYWFSLELEHVEMLAASTPEAHVPVIETNGRWTDALHGASKPSLGKIIANYFRTQDWFRGKVRTIRSVDLASSVPVPHSPNGYYINLVHVDYTAGDGETYVLPLEYAEDEKAKKIREETPQAIIASLTLAGQKTGQLVDAGWDKVLARALLDFIARGRRYKTDFSELSAFKLPAFRTRYNSAIHSLRATSIKSESNSTTIIYKDQLALKLLRHVDAGVNPDWELRRFLSDHTFANTPPVVGYIELANKNASPTTVAILEEFIPHEQDAWQYSLDSLGQFVERVLSRKSELSAPPAIKASGTEGDLQIENLVGHYLGFAQLIGQRTAELHRALASVADDPSFAPEPFTVFYQRSLYESMRAQTDQTMELLRKQSAVVAGQQDLAKGVYALSGEMKKRFGLLSHSGFKGMRIRCNGDYHLGQLRYTGKDVYIAGFEGDLTRPISERRIKRSPLVDVACMLMSIRNVAMVYMENDTVRREDAAFLQPWTRAWTVWVRQCIWDAYLAHLRQTGLVPEDEQQCCALLELYELDRALYELNFSLLYRREWIGTALENLLQITAPGKT
jgi:maltose alpha-D-glucosyltransferase / alpha-amylase